MGITRIMIVGLAALILAPMPPQDERVSSNGQIAAELQTHQLTSVAIGTFTDLTSFCERQPLTCRAMSDIATIAQAKARYAFRLAYEWATDSEPLANTQPSWLQNAMPAAGERDAANGIAEPGAAELQSIPDILNSSSWHDTIVTGTTRKVAQADTGTNTLRIEDILPDWRGPEPSQQG